MKPEGMNLGEGANALPPEAFRRVDETPDEVFYRMPRLVTHIDEEAIGAVTQLYREYFPANGAILDLMSSWISHLPPEVTYGRVAGLGMNREELATNPRLTEFVVQNLNTHPRLPFEDNAFDGVGLCVSIDYLTDPIAVLREAGRVLKPGAPIVITFSNRCFPTKAVALWHTLDDRGHIELVERFLTDTDCFIAPEAFDRSPQRGRSDPLYAVIGKKQRT